jgi:hypothetical protein
MLFAAVNETFAIQIPAAKRLIPTRVKYNHISSRQILNNRRFRN